MRLVLDTTVLIDALRADAAAIAYLEELDEQPICSEVSRVEVIRGLRSRERAAAEQLFAALAWAPVDEAVARLAGELGRKLRSSHRALAVSDLLIAATAGQLNLPLATTNVRHFPMFKGLKPPY